MPLAPAGGPGVAASTAATACATSFRGSVSWLPAFVANVGSMTLRTSGGIAIGLALPYIESVADFNVLRVGKVFAAVL